MAKNIRSGFTIVELLIVIVVIAILATISIVAYRGIQERARASQATSALTQAKKKLELYKVDNSSYPTTGNLASAGVTDGATTYQYTSDGTTYCLTATAGTVSYKTTNTDAPVQGGCAGHGQGGVAAITNYALNPNAVGSTTRFGYAGTPASATSTIASDRAHSGTTSLKRQVTASGQTGAMARVPTNTLRVNAGEKIAWSLWVYSTKAGNLTPYIDATKVSDSTYAGGSSGAVAVPANAWTKVSGTFTASIDIYVTQIGAYNLPVVSGDTLWFDEFMVTKTDSVQNYADGDSTDWTWNGTANDSSSTGPAS